MTSEKRVMTDKEFARAIDKFFTWQPCKFQVGQYVEFIKDFPTAGVKAGDRGFILGRKGAVLPCKNAPKGLPEHYQISSYPKVGFHVAHIKEVV